MVSTSAASGAGLDDLRAAVVNAAGLPSLNTGRTLMHPFILLAISLVATTSSL